MSWLFGLGKGDDGSKVPEMPQFPTLPPPPGGDDDGKGGQGQDNSKMEAYRFDSAALERAAKAAKTLEKSGNKIYKICLSLTRSSKKDPISMQHRCLVHEIHHLSPTCQLSFIT